ncbi:MAG: hypothetical protein RBT71_10315 [Flavobacteriales bacterium]|jgi:hypothetical protein|nr:hypothetical protein [Flavobacteriales bacterium]
MKENPFKLIRLEDEPPGHLRKEVLGSVRLAVLMMRFAQLFLADYAAALFDKFKLLPGDDRPDEHRPRS